MVNFYLKKTVYKGLNRGAKIYLINLLTYVLHLLFLDRRQWLYIINIVLNHHKNLEFHLYWISRNFRHTSILSFKPNKWNNSTLECIPLEVGLREWWSADQLFDMIQCKEVWRKYLAKYCMFNIFDHIDEIYPIKRNAIYLHFSGASYNQSL